MTGVVAPAPVELRPESVLAVPGRPRTGRLPALALLAVLFLMTFSAFAQLGALKRNLPLQDTDEHFFVIPAVGMAASGNPNPHWFGHPGSTVIYPVAVLIHVWDAAAHNGPILGSDRSLEQRFTQDPTPFYVIARLWVIALAVATIPVLFALGRRAFNRRVGLIGAALWAVVPLAIHADRVVRTESAATFFGVVALYFCVRAWQEPRRRWWVYAGLSIGLATSSRYFMVTLLPCLLAAAVLPIRGDRRRAVSAAGTAIVASVAGFVLTSPYVLLDLSTAWHDLHGEASASYPAATGLSPVGNASWYVKDAIPSALTWPLYIAALVGLVVLLWRRRAYQLMLVAFCGIFLVAISASKLHWQHWSIELFPLLALFAAVAVDQVAGVLAARAPGVRHVRLISSLVVALALALTPLARIPKTNRYDNAATTGSQARTWMQANIAPGSRVTQEADTFNIPPWSIVPIGHGIKIDYALDPTKPFSDYRRAGVDYIAIVAGNPFFYFNNPRQHPKEAAFYHALACTTRRVAFFPPSHSRFGPGISIYRLDQAPVRLLDLYCSQPVPARS